ncbi:hypothetical protein [Paenibacillus sp. YN15]|uniref:hypothetical protein n=1 Tax=Paenibacillus sp. YN15 TaxID=1742774 RepID=UPI000DCEC197|nr:hypothetical protein [Paenibacillus sp. YN15]RAU96814.1 hypothetical protein DQG13_19870 [Paenibacillus sp. YN15]
METVKLRCILADDDCFTLGGVYEARESLAYYALTDDMGDIQAFTKRPDEDGDSYATWFELVTEEDRVNNDDYRTYECEECGLKVMVERGTYAEDNDMCAECWCAYQGG